MATFVVVHGAWSAGWVWKKARPLLRTYGHEVFTPSLTGIGERAHLSSPKIDLDTHISDVLGVLEFEDLRDVVLVGHSYGGMVATGAADRAHERLAHLVYVDAAVPRDGQSLFDLHSAEQRTRMRDAVQSTGNGWGIPPNPSPPDTSAEDLAWITPRRLPQPVQTFEQPIRLSGAVECLPRTYIYCTRHAPGDLFRQFANRARADPGWNCFDIDASHNPHVTAPEMLAALLNNIAG